jgi:hypothetical protein
LGVVHSSVTLLRPGVAVTVGASGGPPGLIEAESDVLLEPATFRAATVKVYSTPGVRPVLVQESAVVDGHDVALLGPPVTVTV